VRVGVRLGVAVLVALGINVGVRDAVGVAEGVTPGGSVAVLDAVAVGTSVSAPLVALAAAVLVSIEIAVPVSWIRANGVPVVSGEIPDSSTIACSVEAIAVCSWSSERLAPALNATAVESASTVAFQSIVALAVTVVVPPSAAAGLFSDRAATHVSGMSTIAATSAARRSLRPP